MIGKHTQHDHLQVVEAFPSMATSPLRSSDLRLPSPMSAAVASLFLLAPVEAGTGKAVELDGELLACCAAAHKADQAADEVMDRLDTVAADDPTLMDVLARMQPQIGAYLDAVERAAQIPVKTPEALQAKALLLLLHLRSGEDHTLLAASLARDVVGRA